MCLILGSAFYLQKFSPKKLYAQVINQAHDSGQSPPSYATVYAAIKRYVASGDMTQLKRGVYTTNIPIIIGDSQQTITKESDQLDRNILYNVCDYLNGLDPDTLGITTRLSIGPSFVSRAIRDHADRSPAKALAKDLFDHLSIKLQPEHKAEIGNRLQSVRVSYTYRVKITLGCDGSARSYYHRDSCWWGGYSASRDYVAENGGGAVRIYDTNNDLIGRAWFLPYTGELIKNGIILFNAYGQGDLQHIANWGPIVAQALNKDWCHTGFYPEGHGGDLYLNSSTTVFVGTVITPPERAYRVYLGLETPVKWQYTPKCPVCGAHGVHMYDVQEYEYAQVCARCLDNNFVNVGQPHRSDIFIPTTNAVLAWVGTHRYYFRNADVNDWTFLHNDRRYVDLDRWENR